jgi:probable phosphoglycerate mutase
MTSSKDTPAPKEYRQHRYTAPPGATQLILVRHGESRAATPANPFPMVEGQGNPELAANGRQQALRVAERLRDMPIDAIYVTSLVRTVETAAPLATHLGLEPLVEPDLREVHLGDWEGGLFRIKAFENDPVFQQMQAEQRWDAIPGAESRSQIQDRVGRALANIASRHPDQLVVAVVHGGIVGHILSHAASASHFAFNGCDNGSISQVVLVDGRIIVRGFNDTSHLLETASSAMPT